MWMTENNLTDMNERGYGQLEFILSPNNLNAAYKQVVRNKGAGGIDKMKVESLRDYLIENKDDLIESILRGEYRPNPVRRVEIPKDNGQKRQLGIPTVVDRTIQQAIAQELTRVYEPLFSKSSYGFRPKRNAHQALRRCRDYVTEGYVYAVDLDLEKFFDTVNHSKLMEVLSKTIKDGRVLSLIHKYLRAGVQVGVDFESSEEGVPQGGPLSPLLGNVMLNELDKELERRGHKFARYADDMIIMCKSERSARRVMSSITRFIEGKLFLKVNKEKSQVAAVSKVKFLGYSFYKVKGEGRLRIHPKSVLKMRTRIKALTSRSNGWGNERRKKELRQYITGWVDYYKLADMRSILQKVDEWYRRRLRMVIWKQWKLCKTKRKHLIRLGANKTQARKWSSTRKGCWNISKSQILNTTITTNRLKQAGYVFLTDEFLKVHV